MTTMTAPRTGRTSESRSHSFEPGHALRDAATALGQEADEVCSTLVNKADEAAAATGRGIESVAGQIRSHTPDKGVVGMASNKLADSIESGGKYLENEGVTGLVDDVTSLIRNNPITALCVGVGMGFLLARTLTSRHS